MNKKMLTKDYNGCDGEIQMRKTKLNNGVLF